MVTSAPNPIKDYYIAYFDILGYKAFFNEQPEKVPELLSSIHDVIRRTNNHISIVNNSPIINGMGNIDIHTKVFSDNVLLCMEASNGSFEQIRLLAFLQIIANIQCGFVNEYGLFVRGGILKGQISYNDDYVFGQGLIDVVTVEEKAQYPRIVIAKELSSLFQEPLYSQKELERAIEIEKRLNNKENITPEEQAFYSQILVRNQIQQSIGIAITRLTMQWPDGNWILCYLNMINATLLFGESVKKHLLPFIQMMSPTDFQLLNQPTQDFDTVLQIHRAKIEERLKKYGSNADIAVGDVRTAELREKTLRKYVWVMAFHNQICEFYQKQEHKILTSCNCDARFLKMTIEVLENEAGI